MDQADPPASERFTALAQRFHRPLHIFISSIVRDPELASDLVQDTFIDAWAALQRGKLPETTDENDASIRRWLYHVAYCRAVDALRRKKTVLWQSLDDMEEEGETFETGDDFADRFVEHDALQQALAQLSPQDIACLMLMVVQGFTANEAAQILESTPPAISKRAARAKRRLLQIYLAQNPSVQEERIR